MVRSTLAGSTYFLFVTGSFIGGAEACCGPPSFPRPE